MSEELISNGFTTHQSPSLAIGSNPPPPKKKRNLPGNPDPEAEVIALSPKTLMATNRFLCEICGKGFQRDQNLQLHRRGHNLPWKLKQRTTKEVRKRVYVCPEKSCVHNHPSRALGDLTGIKKHFCRKHGEKKWKCEKCSKRYAVQSDWKAHSKTCGTREYKCDCGTIFSRRDSFITHRAFCDALAEETARIAATSNMNNPVSSNINYHFIGGSSLGPNMVQHFSSIFKPVSNNIDSMEQVRRGPTLWGQEVSIANNNLHQEIHHQQIGSLSSSNPLITPCSNSLPSNYQQVNWDFGSKISSINGNDEVTKSANNKDGELSQVVSVPSLFSNQEYHPSQQGPTPNMSATALLQKAAQIGATTSDISYLGDFGVNCNNNNNNKSQVGQDGNNYGGDLESAVNDLSYFNHQMQMYPSKRRRLQSHEDGLGGQTRDFLGVGVQPICPPSSMNGWM
ncbi:hypothetical protein Leryth_005990 [Lithospermum erythrorhizon]|nr:hypothetical protein Leryth_005990 [Lithospermum erythrorhizon]